MFAGMVVTLMVEQWIMLFCILSMIDGKFSGK
jgi:hypothetical protein